MISNEELTLLHDYMCQTIGDPKRIQIIYALHESPQHVNALAELLDTPQSTISRHLARLKQSGVVTVERDGTMMIYSLVVPDMITIIDQMRVILRQLLEQQSTMLDETL